MSSVILGGTIQACMCRVSGKTRCNLLKRLKKIDYTNFCNCNIKYSYRFMYSQNTFEINGLQGCSWVERVAGMESR